MARTISIRADFPWAGAPTTPSAPAGYTTATLGSEADRSSTYSENHYQCNLRCDPADPANRQCLSMKKGSESGSRWIWTTDGWATSETFTNTGGDPDSVWCANGDLVLSYLSGSVHATRRVAGGGSTVSSTVTVAKMDHPHVWADRTGGANNGRLFLVGVDWNYAGLNISYSGDNAASWTTNTHNINSDITNGFAFTGVVLPTGTLLIPVLGKNTLLSSGGVFIGNQQRIYLVRSTDAGASVSSQEVANVDGPASPGAGGFFGTSNIVHGDGRSYLFFVHRTASPSPQELRMVYSDDDGVTWSSEQTVLSSFESGYGAGSMWAAAKDGLLVVTFYAVGSSYKIWQMWSTDKGATWSSPYALTGLNYTYSGNPRVPGEDQVFGDFHGSTAYALWQDNRSNAGKYVTYTRNTVFS